MNQLVKGLGLATLAAGVTFGFTAPAHALFEIKGGYSFLYVNPSDINDVGSSLGLKFEKMTNLSADVMASLPTMPVGLGVRYETLKANESQAGNEFNSTWRRVSVLVNKRFVDTGAYLGPIVTIGVSSDYKFSTKTAGITTDYKATGNVTASAGIEAGVKMMLIRLGGEAGYMYAPLGDLKATDGTPFSKADGSTAKADMSGTYIRLTAGFGF